MFDDVTIYGERKNNYFTGISEIWNLFIINCNWYYEPGYNVTN